MDDAKKLEIRNFLERGTFKVILRGEVPPDGNVLPGPFFLSIKSSVNGKVGRLPPTASFSHFRSMRMRLAWLANSRPDCLFKISQLPQVTEEHFNASRGSIIRRLNRAMKCDVDHEIRVKVPKLDTDTIRAVGFSDSSFANNIDLSSQLGHIGLHRRWQWRFGPHQFQIIQITSSNPIRDVW